MSNLFSFNDFAPALLDARSFSQTYDVTTDALRLLGFADWMAAFCAWKRLERYSQETFLKCTYDRPVERFFLEKGAIDHDCSIDVCLARGDVMLWSEVDDWIREGKLTEKQEHMVEFVGSQGIFSGVSVPSLTSVPGFAGAGLAAPVGMEHDEFAALWTNVGTDTIRVIQAFHDHAAIFGMVVPKQKLTRKQIEILEARQSGLSIEQVAHELGITVDAVRSRLNTAHKNMGTRGFHELMVKATLTRQI